jgi:hypothetical protein
LVQKALVSLAVLAAVAAAPSAHALEWSDNAFKLSYGTAYREPANSENISKTIFSFTHVDGYRFGSNFLNLDFLYSTSGEGDDVQGVSNVPTAGAMEVYAVYRNTLSFNKIGNTKTFTFGPVRDVGFVLGVDLNTKNHGFSSRKIMPIGGLGFAFNVPGFLNVELLANKEWAVNGITGKSVTFDVTPTLAASWGIPVYGPVTFEGFGSVNLPKGKDGFGNDTKTEVLVQPKVMLDVGKFLGSSGYQIGVGFEYWLNKFGNDHNADQTGGSYAKTVFGQVAIHL